MLTKTSNTPHPRDKSHRPSQSSRSSLLCIDTVLSCCFQPWVVRTIWNARKVDTRVISRHSLRYKKTGLLNKSSKNIDTWPVRGGGGKCEVGSLYSTGIWYCCPMITGNIWSDRYIHITLDIFIVWTFIFRFYPPPPGMRCCRSDWPGLFFLNQPLCVVIQPSWFGLFLFHKFSIFTPYQSLTPQLELLPRPFETPVGFGFGGLPLYQNGRGAYWFVFVTCFYCI